MRSAAKTMTAVAMLALYGLDSAHAQVRAKADVSCKPAPRSCNTTASSSSPIPARTSRCPASLMVGADMPSMPGAHNVRPVSATEDEDKGTYRARIVLEMHGDWALQLDLSGAVRDRVVKMLRFESDRVGEAVPTRKHGPHKH